MAWCGVGSPTPSPGLFSKCCLWVANCSKIILICYLRINLCNFRLPCRVDDAPLIRQASSPHETRIGPSSGRDSAQTWRPPATLIGILNSSSHLLTYWFIHAFSSLFICPPIQPSLSPFIANPFTHSSISPTINPHPSIHPSIHQFIHHSKNPCECIFQCWLPKYCQHNLSKRQTNVYWSGKVRRPYLYRLYRWKAGSEFIDNWKCGRYEKGS